MRNVYLFTKDYKKAIQDYTKVLELDKTDTDIYFPLGAAKASIKDYSGALNDFDNAIKFNPNYGQAYYGRAKIKYYLGDKKSGCTDLSKACSLGIPIACDDLKKDCN